MFYGYARVSTKQQNEDRKIIAFNVNKIDEINIFIDKKVEKTSKEKIILNL